MVTNPQGVTLTDASALVALLDPDERHHARCVATVKSLRGLLLTTWPAFTEAMYLLGRNKGWPAQSALWRLIQEGVLVVAQQPASTRIANLMEQYRDLPMALADASLMRGASVIFSLDNDFHLYRMPKGGVLQVLP